MKNQAYHLVLKSRFYLPKNLYNPFVNDKKITHILYIKRKKKIYDLIGEIHKLDFLKDNKKKFIKTIFINKNNLLYWSKKNLIIPSNLSLLIYHFLKI